MFLLPFCSICDEIVTFPFNYLLLFDIAGIILKQINENGRKVMYGETNKGPDQMKEFINKVAAKLGLPSEKVEAAVKSVRKEWMEKMVTDRIQEAVQKGTITQAEAGQILEWLKNRPDGVQKLMGQMFGQMGGMMGMGGRKGMMGSHM
jgi:hypothetical protein